MDTLTGSKPTETASPVPGAFEEVQAYTDPSDDVETPHPSSRGAVHAVRALAKDGQIAFTYDSEVQKREALRSVIRDAFRP